MHLHPDRKLVAILGDVIIVVQGTRCFEARPTSSEVAQCQSLRNKDEQEARRDMHDHRYSIKA